MMGNHFMLADLVRVTGALILYVNILVAPGYVVAWLINALGFRSRALPTRLAISLTTSIGICPVATYLLAKFVPMGIWPFYGSAVLLFLVLLFTDYRGRASNIAAISRQRSLFFVVAAVWVSIAMFVLVDFQLGDRLYFPYITYDYALRADVTASITRTGVPPNNPLFFPGHPYTLRYHYFWYILCSLVSQLGGSGITARIAIIAGAIWCGLGLMALIPLYLRFFQPGGKTNIDRRGLIGIALLCITGIDILPVLLVEMVTKRFVGSMEWWNEQITAWANIALWVPHHLAGLIACLTGFLILWDARGTARPSQRIIVSVVAGIMFASATGLSIYVTFVFAICLAVWLVAALFREMKAHAGLLCLSGCVAILLSIPFVLELAGRADSVATSHSSVTTATQIPFEFQVRKFPMLMVIMDMQPLDKDARANLVNFLGLPLNYLCELGFFAIAGIVWCGRMWRNRRHIRDSQLCAFTLTATSMIVCSFVRSSVIGANDLGWRGFMIAQFILLLCAAELLAEGLKSTGEARALLVLTMFFGASGTIYDVLKIRFVPVLSDVTPAARISKWLSNDDKLGERTYAMRQIYDQLRAVAPETAVVQHNPDVVPQDNFHGMYADRQIAAETMSCGVVFGGDEAECKARVAQIAELFSNGEIDPASIDDKCSKLSIDYLVVQSGDTIWPVASSWIWKRVPMLANSYARVFACGSKSRVSPSSHL